MQRAQVDDPVADGDAGPAGIVRIAGEDTERKVLDREVSRGVIRGRHPGPERGIVCRVRCCHSRCSARRSSTGSRNEHDPNARANCSRVVRISVVVRWRSRHRRPPGANRNATGFDLLEHRDRVRFRGAGAEEGGGEEHIEEAVHDRAGAIRGVGERMHRSHGMVETGRGLERDPCAHGIGHEAGEHRGAGDGVRRDAASADLGAGASPGDGGQQRRGIGVDRDLDEQFERPRCGGGERLDLGDGRGLAFDCVNDRAPRWAFSVRVVEGRDAREVGREVGADENGQTPRLVGAPPWEGFGGGAVELVESCGGHDEAAEEPPVLIRAVGAVVPGGGHHVEPGRWKKPCVVHQAGHQRVDRRHGRDDSHPMFSTTARANSLVLTSVAPLMSRAKS